MDTKFFIQNRQNLSEKINRGILVMSANRQMQRSNDASFAFEQEANFWYLTGINAPDWLLIMDGSTGKSWLVAPDIDSTHKLFDGSLDWDEAKHVSGVDGVLSKLEANDLMHKLADHHKIVYTLLKHPHSKSYDFVINPAQYDLKKQLKSIFYEVKDCRVELARLRAIKQPFEIDSIREAIKLTTSAFYEVKNILPSLKYEYQVEAEFSYRLRSAGATGHAYDPIVASGSNAVTLHYNANNQPLGNDELLLIDIGARLNGYAADITRTYAIGRPNERQAAVHGAVEKAHQQIINLLKPNQSVKKYQDEVNRIMQNALIDLGLLKTRSDTESFRKYFPHAISHGLGIDVHDSLGGPDIFEPGMILTVEPGIYIPEEGIGVRIEDDILITNIGHENLSSSLPTSM